MHPPPRLPTSLLLILPLVLPSVAVAAAPPNNNHGTTLPRRDAESRERISHPQAAGVKKMSDDEGEKFFFDYWYFDDISNLAGNSSLVDTNPEGGIPYRLSFPLHSDSSSSSGSIEDRGLFERYLLPVSHHKRSFKCPSGTSSCTSINRPNSCCSTGETCQIIPDTGLGDVGCCASGDNCSGGGVAECEDGYTSCPDNPGGGCCIPGYSCRGEGCVNIQTETVTFTRTIGSDTSTYTSTTTATDPDSTASSPDDTSSATETKTNTETETSTSSATETIAPPIRPTTNPTATATATATITSDTATTSSGDDGGGAQPTCPTGFYACSAVYHGGCCRVGRDCHSTSCPTSSSTTIVNENGKTLVVPVPTGDSDGDNGDGPTARPTGRCAEGWFGCGEEDGGGCCPEGFECEIESCKATGKGVPTGEVGKIAAEGGAAGREVSAGGMGIGSLVGLIFLLL